MGFRDLDATKAMRELWVSVRCNMTALTSACRIASKVGCALQHDSPHQRLQKSQSKVGQTGARETEFFRS